MAFVLPHVDSIRPWWLVRAGLYLYDALAWGTQLPHSRGLRQSDVAYRTPLRGLVKGFVYSDAFVDDSRLTLANAIDAAENGADILTRTELITALRDARLCLSHFSIWLHVSLRTISTTPLTWFHFSLLSFMVYSLPPA